MSEHDLLQATIDLEAIRPRLQQKHERAFRLVRDAQRLVLSPHPDADGLAAAALIVTGFKIPDRRWKLLPINTPSRSYTRDDLADLRRINPDIITFLDLSPNNPRQMQQLKRTSSLVGVDHHRPPAGLLDEMLLGINPEPEIGESAGSYSTSKLVYDLIGASARPDLALIGITGDRTSESWRAFMKSYSSDEVEFAERVAKRLSTIGMATRVDQFEPRPATLKRQRTLFTYLVHAKTLPAFITSIESTRTLKEVYEEVEEATTSAAGKAQIALESGVEFVHVPIKPGGRWSVISGARDRLDLVAPGQTVFLTEQWYRGVEMRMMTNDPDIDVPTVLKGFGGGHATIGGGHAAARASEVVDVIRERWGSLKNKPER